MLTVYLFMHVKALDLIILNFSRDIINLQSLHKSLSMEIQRRRETLNELQEIRVVINISGNRFETFQSTLELYPNTLLGDSRRRMYLYDRVNNEFFFDRNRSCFEAILYFYQSHGKIRRPEFVPIDTFLEEIIFFDLGNDAVEQVRKDENLEEIRQKLLPKNRFCRYLWAT